MAGETGRIKHLLEARPKSKGGNEITMAIDGRIRQARRIGDHLLIRIAPRVYDNKHLTNPGQRRLLICNATYIPIPGQVIWGGSDSVRIEPLAPGGKTRVYRRITSTRLEEVNV